jgi:hypothetical protein
MYNSRKDQKLYQNNIEALANLKKTFEEMKSKHDKPLSPVTIKNYVAKMNKLSTLILDKTWDGKDTWLYKPDKVIDALKTTHATGLKDFISPIVRLLKAKEAPQEILEKYQKAMSLFKNDEYSVRKLNKSSQKEMDNSISYKDIIQKINDYKPSNLTELTYLLICKLYFQGTIVFRNDLSCLKLVSASKKAKDLKSQYNYVTLDKNGEPSVIIMRNYKSKETYGVQRFPVSNEVKECLIAYLKQTGKQPGDYVFTNGKGLPYTKDSIRDLIAKSTEAVLGNSININLIDNIKKEEALKLIKSLLAGCNGAGAVQSGKKSRVKEMAGE